MTLFTGPAMDAPYVGLVTQIGNAAIAGPPIATAFGSFQTADERPRHT
ncbi:hypothetical protein [Dactylosporangium sp. CA-233914]